MIDHVKKNYLCKYITISSRRTKIQEFNGFEIAIVESTINNWLILIANLWSCVHEYTHWALLPNLDLLD